MASPTLPIIRSTSTQTRFLEALLSVLAIAVALLGGMVIGATEYSYLILAATLALAVATSILIRPELGLYILVVFVFANLSDVLEVQFGIPDSNKFLVGLIFAGTFATRIMMQKQPIIFQITELLIMIYGLVIIASLFFAPGAPDSITLVIDWAKNFAIILIIVQFATDERIWKRMQWVLIMIAAFLATLSAYQVLTGSYDSNFFGLANAPVFQVTDDFDNHRVTGPIFDPNYYGMFLMMVLPIALYRILTDQNPVARMIALLLATPILLTILFTYSRGAFVSLIVVSLLIAFERQFSPYKVIPIVLVVIFFLAPVLPAGFVERLATLADVFNVDPRNQTELSLRGRSSEAIIAYRMFLDHPLLGVGYNNYAANYLSYSSRVGIDRRFEERDAHSMYLEVAAETGIIGVMAFSAMIVALFIGMHRARQILFKVQRADLVGWVNGIQFGLLGYMLASLFLHADYVRYFWLIVGLSASCLVMAQTQKARFTKPRIEPGFSSLT